MYREQIVVLQKGREKMKTCLLVFFFLFVFIAFLSVKLHKYNLLPFFLFLFFLPPQLLSSSGVCGCCGALRPRYKRLVDNIFPEDPEVRSSSHTFCFLSKVDYYSPVLCLIAYRNCILLMQLVDYW